MSNISINSANIEFWNELCGTNTAKALGITDASPESLKKFDDWYFSIYKYLFSHVPLDELAGRDVLEIGLGYGSLSQKIAESGARYTGLDIAPGPVDMVKHRLAILDLTGVVEQGSLLDAPFAEGSFDRIITIGCLHHTGNMAKGIEECRRMLKPGGTLTFMVYYAYSYRRWMQARKQTFSYLVSELFGYRGVAEPAEDRQRWLYDHNSRGEAAPHTDFISVSSLKHLCKNFSDFKYRLRNIDQEPPFRKRTREELLNTVWPGICGLEIYADAIKG